jgi:hypothetical protein
MPIPQQLGRGNRMGRGPYEKAGLVQDSSLPPLRTVASSFDIFFPYEDKENEDGDTVRTFPTDTLNVEVKLTYMPYGTPDDDAFVWREEKRTVTITPGK